MVDHLESMAVFAKTEKYIHISSGTQGPSGTQAFFQRSLAFVGQVGGPALLPIHKV